MLTHRELFHVEFPDDLLRAICRQVVRGYQDAWQYCLDNYDFPQRHDVYPMMRRADIERNAATIVERFPPGTAVAVANRVGAAYHVRITSGRVRLTFSAVNERGQVVRPAIFRKQYASNSQTNLFDLGAGADDQDDSALYAILLHGGTKKRPQIPAFMDIGFPDAECKSYVDTINLFARFSEISDWLQPTVQAAIQVPAARLRVVKREEEGSE